LRVLKLRRSSVSILAIRITAIWSTKLKDDRRLSGHRCHSTNQPFPDRRSLRFERGFKMEPVN